MTLNEDYLRIRGKLLDYKFENEDELLYAVQYIRLVENTFNNLASGVRDAWSRTVFVLYPLIGYRGIKRMLQKFVTKREGWEVGIHKRCVVLAYNIDNFTLQLIYSYPKKLDLNFFFSPSGELSFSKEALKENLKQFLSLLEDLYTIPEKLSLINKEELNTQTY
jgi:hypothetical protein